MDREHRSVTVPGSPGISGGTVVKVAWAIEREIRERGVKGRERISFRLYRHTQTDTHRIDTPNRHPFIVRNQS